MCGIAGLMLKDSGNIGEMLVSMLDGVQHRGPDSTGFAVYHDRQLETLICRIYLKCDSASAEAIDKQQRVSQIIAQMGGTVLEERFEQQNLRLVINYAGDVKPLCYAIEDGAGVEILSIGHKLEIIKGVGSSYDVDARYGLTEYMGTHGIGHVRLATESRVNVSGAHPFWAYGFNDVAIVHNGQITNYFKMKRRLMQRGFQFRTENDSELIAVYLADKLTQGRSLDETLEESIYELDGTFSFLVSTADSIGFAKDPLGAKPMVVMEQGGVIGIASEEVALQRVFATDTLSTYEPFPGTFKTWHTSTLAAKL